MECYQQAGLRETVKGVKDFEALGVHDGVCMPRCNKCLSEFHVPPESLSTAMKEREEKREYKLGLPTEMACAENVWFACLERWQRDGGEGLKEQYEGTVLARESFLRLGKW